jgi:SulP family sulfate permease
MGEWREFGHLRKYSVHYRLLMLGTFFLTVVFDLTVAVQVGLVLACALFIRKMSSLFNVEQVRDEGEVLRFKLYGSLFFGAVSKIDHVVEAVENGPPEPAVILDALQLVHLDTSGLDSLRQLHKVILLRNGTLAVENLQAQPLEVIERSGFGTELSAHLASPEVAI